MEPVFFFENLMLLNEILPYAVRANPKFTASVGEKCLCLKNGIKESESFGMH